MTTVVLCLWIYRYIVNAVLIAEVSAASMFAASHSWQLTRDLGTSCLSLRLMPPHSHASIRNGGQQMRIRFCSERELDRRAGVEEDFSEAPSRPVY